MTTPGASNKTAIGVSWGSETGVVSNSIISNKQLQTANLSEIIKHPSVLANADGNRTPYLWLNVANEEFLLSDGARNSTLRFPQQGIHGVINLLDQHSVKQTLRKEKSQNEEGGFRCVCGCPCSCKKVRVYESEDASENNNDDEDVEDEITNFKAMTVHTDAKDSTTADFQGKFSVFLDQMKRNLKLDSDGLIPKTTFKVDSEDDDGNAIVEDAVRLPETTWECALGVARIFRTIIKDSLTGSSAASSPTSTTASSSSQFPSSSSGLEQPTTIVVSIPRHRTNTHAAYSLLRLAWHDWCMKSPKNQHPSQLKIVHDDVAAFAAVLPKDRLLNCANDKTVTSGDSLTTPHVALVVNWGATQLTVSLMLQTCEPVIVTKSTDDSPAKKSHPMMICLASKTLDREVGGFFIDQKVTETELLMTAKRKRLPPVEASSRGYRKFLGAAERAKIVLSSSQTTSVEIEAAVEGMDFVDPSFTRSKLENVISSACRLPMKFNELVTSLFAEFSSSTQQQQKVLPLFSREGVVKFGVVISGGTLAIPSLQNHVKNQGTQMLEKFLQQHQNSSKKIELVNANYNFAGTEPQEICSIGACYLAQTGCVLDITSSVSSFSLSSEKKRATIFAKPQLSLLSSDILLMKKDVKENGVVVFPSGCNVPARRQITGTVSNGEYSGFAILNRVQKTAVMVPFDEATASEKMTLQCTISNDGIFKVADASNGGAKVCEVQLS